MPHSLASRQRKHSGGTAGGESSTSAFASAGVHVVHLSGGTLEDRSGVVRHWLNSAKVFTLRAVLRQLDADARRDLVRALGKARRGGQSSCEVRTPEGASRQRWFRVHPRFEQTEDGAHWSAILVETTAEHECIERHMAGEEHLRHMVEYNPQLPWIADSDGQIIDFTDRWLNSTGLSRDEAIGQGWLAATHPEDVVAVSGTISHCLATGEPFDVTVRLRVNGNYRWMRAQGYPQFDEAGKVSRWYGYTEDVHEKVLIDQQIRWDAEHDALTGLHNRSYFSSALGAALASATANFRKVALLLVDVDNFKDVNDLLGHRAGDELLNKFGQFLAATVPDGSLVARLGGDEFAVLLDNIDDVSTAIGIGETIAGTEGELRYGGRALTYHASVGIGLFPSHGINANQLLRHTDLALYSAKANGGGHMQVFEKDMLDEMHERLAMVNRARTAARDNRVLAYYQPKVCLQTGALAGFEALLRWQDDLGNIHTPASIYAAFDEKGVADLLGKAMINHVLEDIVSWRSQGLDFHTVAINASPAEMRQAVFVDNLIEALDQYEISTGEIEIEITEGVFLGANADASRSAIQRMNERGIPLALDDFGTGYASLSHIRNLPISTLKIDRSFVSDISASNADLAIVAAIISMGKAMGMRVIAEGIENASQERVLKDLSCEFGQGFYFGKPVPSHEVPELIRSWNGQPSLPPRRTEPGELRTSGPSGVRKAS